MSSASIATVRSDPRGRGSEERAYLHGFTPDEQARLLAQAKVLEPGVFGGVEFPGTGRVLEVGCGVGAQTSLLLSRFPGISVSAVDVSPGQITRAEAVFRDHPARDRAIFRLADGCSLPFDRGTHVGAFCCWLLEHVSEPVRLLREVRRVLEPGATLHLNEVFNQLLYVRPQSRAIERYWREYNRLQEDLGGDPQVGVKIGHYLKEAGFTDIQVEPHAEHWDSRGPETRGLKVRYWTTLMLSAAPQLLERGQVTSALVEEMRAEMARAEHEPDGILFFGWMKARARVPA